jgi:hypothetical protein
MRISLTPILSPFSVPLLSTLLSLTLCAPAAARAQQTQIPASPPLTTPGAVPNPGPEQDPGMHRMIENMAARRNTERQKEIISDSARLLALAQKLNDEVSKTNKNTLSVPVVKEAEEIEKLAKSIKTKMRDGD